MSITLIPALSDGHIREEMKTSQSTLNVAEFFSDTIQGEGVYIGQPATFLRLHGCTLCCNFCDSSSVWKYGKPYTFDELLDMIDSNGLVNRLKRGQHFVVTGGSPLKQQDNLVKFFNVFVERFNFLPFIEIENESTLLPSFELIDMVGCWNNSPKLTSSGNSKSHTYKPDVLKRLSSLENSWFKFVVSNQTDWKDINDNFIRPGHIRREQVVLMPLGGDITELTSNRMAVIDIAVKESVRYSTREHIILWNKKTGV